MLYISEAFGDLSLAKGSRRAAAKTSLVDVREQGYMKRLKAALGRAIFVRHMFGQPVGNAHDD